MRAPPQLAVIRFPLLLPAPKQREGVRVHDRSGIVDGILVFDGGDHGFEVRADFVGFGGEVAEVAGGLRDAVVEDGGFEVDAGLAVGEIRRDGEGEGEDAAVEIGHGGAEEGEGPDEGVAGRGEADFHAGVGVLRVVPLVLQLLELEGQLCRELGGVCRLRRADLFPRLPFVFELLGDALEALVEVLVVEVAFHAVRCGFENRPPERRAVFLFFGEALDGLGVGVVVPEEAALHEICEGIPIAGLQAAEGRLGIVVECGGFGVGRGSAIAIAVRM